ncbi:hypothetical protein [Methylobacterium sp. Gmos1]
MELRTAFIKHTKVGKSTQAEGTAAAHYRYACRKSATDYVESYIIPGNYWEAQDYFNKREKNIRKNGRVIDKFALIFPVGMKQIHAVAATRTFLQRIGKGRGPYFFALQNFKDGTVNPHAHCIFVDECAWSGRRVFRTSDRGSSKRLRQEFVSVANEILQQQEYTFRVDMRTMKELQHEMELQQHIPEMELAAQERVIESLPQFTDDSDKPSITDLPQDAPIHELDEPAEEAHARTQTHAEETAMADEDDGQSIARPLTLVDQIRAAHESGKHIERIEADRQTHLRLRESYAIEHTDMVNAQKAAESAKLDVTTAENELGDLRRQRGIVRQQGDGFRVLGWDSPARARANELDAMIHTTEVELARRRTSAAQLETHATYRERTAWEVHRKIEAHDRKLFGMKVGNISDLNALIEISTLARDEALRGVEPADVYQSWLNGAITDQQAEAALKRLEGGNQYLKMMHQRQLQEHYQHLGHTLQ